MEQAEFLEKNVFKGLENLNDGFADAQFQFFSETDFETVLERAEYYGIGIYAIEAWEDNEFFEAAHNEYIKKKATDPTWYKKALLTFKMTEPGMIYGAMYKVSPKLLARQSSK
jgi:hypothetical protein